MIFLLVASNTSTPIFKKVSQFILPVSRKVSGKVESLPLSRDRKELKNVKLADLRVVDRNWSIPNASVDVRFITKAQKILYACYVL